MEDWDSQCGGAQFRYDTIRLPSPHPGKVNATTARYMYILWIGKYDPYPGKVNVKTLSAVNVTLKRGFTACKKVKARLVKSK